MVRGGRSSNGFGTSRWCALVGASVVVGEGAETVGLVEWLCAGDAWFSGPLVPTYGGGTGDQTAQVSGPRWSPRGWGPLFTLRIGVLGWLVPAGPRGFFWLVAV